jgi:hypothetical protein
MSSEIFDQSCSRSDGEYVLTANVSSPLPTRLQTRRRGWIRAPHWPKDTHFVITDGNWSCDHHYGYRNGASALTPKQRANVFRALRANMQRWAPALPSHVVGYSGKEVLDFLFATGKFTMDEVKEAHACLNIGEYIGDALAALCKAPPPPPSAPVAAPQAQAPGAPGTILRIGDVIRPVGDRYVVCDRNGNEYTWQGDGYHSHVFVAPYEPSSGPVIGHVADMLAEGLRALNHAPCPKQTCVHCGVTMFEGQSLHAPTCLLQSLRIDGAVLGYDSAGTIVRVGDTLHGKDTANPATVFLVTGAFPPDADGPRVSFKQLAGPTAPWNAISLERGNLWRCVPASPPEHMPPPVEQFTSRRDREPVDTASLFSLD